ncbi:MAG: hypothetical protein MI741_03500, partial [Rhodospirillales bacterium]|nr:hypothetical protein [Rhodospirillales bacterium]
MPLSTDIRIPRNLEPDWPDRCVRCGEPHPTRQARLWTHSIGWWSVLLLPWARPYTLKVPVCDRCIGPMRFNRLLRVLITWGVLIA